MELQNQKSVISAIAAARSEQQRKDWAQRQNPAAEFAYAAEIMAKAIAARAVYRKKA